MLNASDDATPNANAIMLTNLVHLFQLTGNTDHVERAENILKAFDHTINANVVGHCGLLAGALDLMSPLHVALVGRTYDVETSSIGEALNQVSLPGCLEEVALGNGRVRSPSLAGISTTDVAAAYVCAGTQCSAPITTPDALSATLKAKRARPGATLVA
jgi:uncharacterized protein YyaL (SSP411 family)